MVLKLLPQHPFPGRGLPETASVSGDATARQNLLQMIQLRWIAVTGQIITIAFVQWVLDVPLPLRAMALVLATLIGLNVVGFVRVLFLRRIEVHNRELLGSLLLDVAALTALLYLSGGAANPFIFLYPLQVTLGAVLLDAWSVWTIVGVTILCFAALTRFYVPLALPRNDGAELFRLHILGMFICFVLDAALLVVFVSRINRNLRARDARLAALRQRAAEEDHIVRMGLLASGAAHELGTPLSSLSVILGDWRRMSVFWQNPELLQEIADMQEEVTRCKTIVTGILMSAGEARGEAPVVTTIKRFLNDLVGRWRTARATRVLDYTLQLDEDRTIVSDAALRQIINNVLDNALEASPGWVSLEASVDEEMLRLTVRDRGPGFAPEMLAQFGKPYQSSKGRPGGGLGLFLVVNVVRKLGGQVNAENADTGGAVVTLELPLSALLIEDETDEWID